MELKFKVLGFLPDIDKNIFMLFNINLVIKYINENFN